VGRDPSGAGRRYELVEPIKARSGGAWGILVTFTGGKRRAQLVEGVLGDRLDGSERSAGLDDESAA